VNGGFRLANGRGAALADLDPLNRESFLAVAEVGGGDKDARIFLAAAFSQRGIEENFAPYLETNETVSWNSRTEAVEARRQKRLGALVLEDSHWMNAPSERVARALLDGVRALGLAALPWTDAARQIQARVAFLRKDASDGNWPDFSDEALSVELERWLLPYLDGMRNRADFARLDLAHILADRLDWERKQKLEQEAPSHIRLPSGRTAALDYGGDAPVLAAKVQELFGLADTPRIGRNGVPITIHILSPASRPVQVTNDLAGFWRGSYSDVRKDLRGRYPKHRWPEDPTKAEPLAPGRSRR
jgi:ATP-dependent helicase HrpB